MQNTLPALPKRYLKPSVFWGIRQSFPRSLGFLVSCCTLLVLLGAWAIASYGGFADPKFLPTPTAVLRSGVEMIFTPELKDSLIIDAFVSCWRVFLGFMAAAIIGIPVGIAMGTFKSMESLFMPIVGTVRYMPIAAFVPLIILWVGLEDPARVTIIFLGIVFYNALMVADAVKFIPNESLNVAYTLGANRFDVLVRVIMPAIIPSIIDTLRVNVSGAWNFLVIAEYIATDSGLGFRILQSQRFFQTEKVLFVIAVIGVIGLLTDYLFNWINKLVTPWTEERTN